MQQGRNTNERNRAYERTKYHKVKRPTKENFLNNEEGKKLTREEPKEQNQQSPKTEKKEVFLTQISKQRKLF